MNFTDHWAIALRLAIENPVARRGTARWKMDHHLIQDAGIRAKIRQKCDEWRKNTPYFPDVDTCLDHYVKRQLQIFMRREEDERRQDHKRMEEHLYECIYDIQRSNAPLAETLLSEPLQSTTCASTRAQSGNANAVHHCA